MTPKKIDPFPERLLIAIRRRKILQQDLANEIGVAPRTISKYIHGHVIPPIETLRKMADALEVSVDWLLGRTDDSAGLYAEGVRDDFVPQVKILYRALRNGDEPSSKTLMMLAESIIKEREEAEKKLLDQRRKEGGHGPSDGET